MSTDTTVRAGSRWSSDQHHQAFTTPGVAIEQVPFLESAVTGLERPATPEELVVAAHAASVAQAFGDLVRERGLTPANLDVAGSLLHDGPNLDHLQLDIAGAAAGLSREAFLALVTEAIDRSVISTALRDAFPIDVHVAPTSIAEEPASAATPPAA